MQQGGLGRLVACRQIPKRGWMDDPRIFCPFCLKGHRIRRYTCDVIINTICSGHKCRSLIAIAIESLLDSHGFWTSLDHGCLSSLVYMMRVLIMAHLKWAFLIGNRLFCLSSTLLSLTFHPLFHNRAYVANFNVPWHMKYRGVTYYVENFCF